MLNIIEIYQDPNRPDHTDYSINTAALNKFVVSDDRRQKIIKTLDVLKQAVAGYTIDKRK